MTKVLDKGEVELLDYMGDDLEVANSARVSFGNRNKTFGPKDEKLIKYLMGHHHTSPMRHCQLKFRMKLPIFVLRQLQKQRVGVQLSENMLGEINEISGRYVNLGNVEFYIPKEFRKQSENNKQASEGLIKNQNEAWNLYTEAISQSLETYNKMIDLGVCREQARCVLPVSMYTEIQWTVSLQAALFFVNLRDSDDAQKETREYAKVVRAILEEKFPITTKYYFEAKNV